MAQESKPQQETIERVMHEFKHGELKTAGGRKVKSRRQAVAIGLSEAGASNQQDPAENRRRLKDTKRRERAAETGRDRAGAGSTRADLYEQARRKNIPGRSKMSKAELAKAIEG